MNPAYSTSKEINCRRMTEADLPQVYICTLSKTTNTPAINFFLKNGFTRGYDFAWIYQSLGENQ